MNKIKNAFSVKMKPILVVFFFASVVCVIIRCLQTAKYIDPSTGFITGGELLNILLIAIFLICALAFLVSSFLSNEAKQAIKHGEKSNLCAIGSVFLAVSFGIDWIGSFFKSVGSLFSIGDISDVRNLMTDGSLPLAGQSLFAFFSAIYFFILFSDFKKGKSNRLKFKLIAIAPVGWSAFRMIHRFIRQISFVEVSDLFLELIMLGFMIIFFMAFAQVNSGVYSDGFSWRLFGFGLSAALISLTLSITRLIFLFVDGGSFINSSHQFFLPDLTFAFFIIAMLMNSVSKTSQDNNVISESNSQNEGE